MYISLNGSHFSAQKWGLEPTGQVKCTAAAGGRGFARKLLELTEEHFWG